MSQKAKTDAQLIREISRRVMREKPGDFYRRGKLVGGTVRTGWKEKGSHAKKANRQEAA